MTQPHIIGPGAKARSVTDKLISSLLTVMVNQLTRGAARDRITDLVGVELNDRLIDLDRMRLLTACALSRLARMHHAVEQLADQWTAQAPDEPVEDGDCSAMLADNAAELRKLVDDHG